MKANRVLACMRRGFINLIESVLLQVNGLTYTLEYGNVIWGPHYVAIRSMQTLGCTMASNKTCTIFKR